MKKKRFTTVSMGREEAYCDFSIIKVGDKIISEIPTTDAIKICDLLNEQSDTIEGLILDRYRQEEKLDIARRNLSKQLEKIDEQQTTIQSLKGENEKLRQFINKGRRLSVKELMDNANENELLKKKIKGLEKENEQLHYKLQQTKEYLQTKIDECKNHKKMKEIVFGVEQAVGYEKALLQFQKGLKRRLNDE